MRAIVRPPGDSFVRALSKHPQRDSIDVERARAQHESYVECLEAVGIEVIRLEPQHDLPDACFTQDVALVLEGCALLTRPATSSRRPEPSRMEATLAGMGLPISSTDPPATLEGGDVLQVDRRLIVGRSARTNQEGVEALRGFCRPLGYEVVEARVPVQTLHLLTDVSVLSNGVLVGTEEVLNQTPFTHMDRITASAEEREGCNALSVGRHVILGGFFPGLRRALEEIDRVVHELDLSEFAKADGGPTCLSLMVPDP